jgi:hypothetical protein
MQNYSTREIHISDPRIKSMDLLHKGQIASLLVSLFETVCVMQIISNGFQKIPLITEPYIRNPYQEMSKEK